MYSCMLFYIFIFQGEHPHHMLARNKPSKDIIDAFKVLLNNECVELDLTIFNNDGQTVTDIALDKGSLISEGIFTLVSSSQKCAKLLSLKYKQGQHFRQKFTFGWLCNFVRQK